MDEKTLSFSVLERIRADFRDLPLGKQLQAEKAIGKRRRYLLRVTPRALKLGTIFAFGRFLGYQPSFYLARLLFGHRHQFPWIPPGPKNLFRDFSRLCSDEETSEALGQFLAWGQTEALGTSESAEFAQEEESQLVCVSDSDPAGLLMARWIKRPRVSSSQMDLLGAITFLVEVSLQERKHHQCFLLLDMGFRLEASLQCVASRSQLFEAAAQVCGSFGLIQHREWCLREASYLSLLVPDYEKAQQLSEQVESKLTSAKLKSADGPAASLASKEMRQGSDDLGLLLAIMSVDRRAAPLTAGELDARLGAKRAFSMAVKGRAPMSLERWLKCLEALRIEPDLLLRRFQLLDRTPCDWSGFSFRFDAPSESPAFVWLDKLIEWADAVHVEDLGDELDGFDDTLEFDSPDSVFPRFAKALEATLQEPPRSLSLSAATRLCHGLDKSAYLLRRRGLFLSALRFHDALFRVAKKFVDFTFYAKTWRTASRTVLEMGQPLLSQNFLGLAKDQDFQKRCPAGLSRTLFQESVMAYLSSAYDTALRLNKAALNFSAAYGGYSKGLLLVGRALILLRLGRADQALAVLDRVAMIVETETRPSELVAEYLLARASCLSTLGDAEAAMRFFDAASRTFAETGRTKDLIIVEVEKCRHFVENGLRAQLELQSRVLLKKVEDLSENPIGQDALLTLIGQLLLGGGRTDSVQETIDRVQYPFLNLI